MLFNSYTYLLLFLPLVVVGFHLLRKAPFRVSVGWLVVASFLYYGWWNPRDLWVIGGSCIANFLLGRFISRQLGSRRARGVLIVGVVANLGLIGYYKYVGLFAKTFSGLIDGSLTIPELFLPLGISFFTFQQIAYLIDAHRGETHEYHFTDYLLFVTFFPQLIAGPIVHHKEMLPQFQRQKGRGVRSIDLSIGISYLAMGLFKKVVMADYLARTATPLFALAASADRPLTMAEAWAAALAYALQIYFDFSGYSDMAIGSARLFGIRLPLNFHSPYKATSVVDFWRRWHITLSRFLRDYLYIPLGGNRKGPSRRYMNLMITMLLGGLWHGAGWTFVLWGGLHGLFLCLNNAWFWLRKRMSLSALPKPLAIGLTFLAVLIAWVPFRAGNFEIGASGSTSDALGATWSILGSMFGWQGVSGWPPEAVIVASATRAGRPIAIGLVIVFLLPNTQEFFRRYRPALRVGELAGSEWKRRWWQWRPTWPWLLFTLGLLYAVGREFDQISEFIYFQF